MKGKWKSSFLLIIAVVSMLVVCVALGFFGQNEEDVIINRIVGIVAIISGIGSVIMGISSIFSASLDNVREYYATGDSKEMASARHVLYNYRYIKIKYGKTVFDEDFDEWVQKNIHPEGSPLRLTSKNEVLAAAAVTADFFQMWGLLQSKNFLPMWVFETASGYSIIRLYEAAADIFAYHRLTNPFYAMQYHDLCARIFSKYRKDIAKCREKEREYIQKELAIKSLADNAHFNISIK